MVEHRSAAAGHPAGCHLPGAGTRIAGPDRHERERRRPPGQPAGDRPVRQAEARGRRTAAARLPRPGELPVLETAPSGTPPWIESEYWPARAEVRVNELRRDRNGYVSLVWTVRNDDDQPLNVWTSSHDYSRVYAEASTSAAAIVSGRYRYRPLRDSVHNVTLGPYLFVTSQDEYVVADDRTAYATR